MSDEAAFHEGYCKALQDVSELLTKLDETSRDDLSGLVAELSRRIERARCSGKSSLAAGATGHAGY